MSLDSVLRSLRNVYAQHQTVQKHVSNLLRSIRTLQPQASSFISNTGHTSNLLQLSGTVPIFYRGSQYNIPVDIYIPENYPSRPPQAFVRPTNDMLLKPNHRHVDREGLVYMPYLLVCNLISNLV